ncbi:hypothetical protein AAVH_40556, partial [Aphelenchoides avenae]
MNLVGLEEDKPEQGRARFSLAVDDLLGDLRMAKLTEKASLDETEIIALLLFLVAYY